MKIPWPQPFEDGNIRQFLEDFDDVAEASGIKSDRGKMAALRSLLKGRAKAALGAARRGPALKDKTALCILESSCWEEILRIHTRVANTKEITLYRDEQLYLGASQLCTTDVMEIFECNRNAGNVQVSDIQAATND